MNIKEQHDIEKPVSASMLFKGELGTVTTIRISKGEQLKEHLTKIPALLLCIEGRAVFQTKTGVTKTLLPGDYLVIEPMIKHWVEGVETSQLVLIK